MQDKRGAKQEKNLKKKKIEPLGIKKNSCEVRSYST